MKKLISLFLLCALLLLCACGAEGGSTGGDGEKITVITLNGTGASVKGGGASVKDNVVTIKAVGTYSVTGELTDGQLVVDTGEDAVDVTILLENASVTNLSGPALHILQAKNVRLRLAEGSVNTLCSGTERPLGQVDESISGGAIFAEDDLDIEGSGTLRVLGYLNNGITCKDDLDINSGTLEVVAVNNGIRASESLELKGGTVEVRCGNDGLKTSSAAKEGKGFITLSGGELNITCGGDSVAAETELRPAGGSVTVNAQGDPALGSSKGLKGKTGLVVSGGTAKVTAEDHALHSDASLSISGGELELSANNGKGIDADGDVSLSGGSVRIQSSGDGISSPTAVLLSGGELDIASRGDGVQAGESGSGTGSITLSGGEVQICAMKKSLDAKGSLALTGGELFALSGSEKQAGPTEGSDLPWLLCRLSGDAGQTVMVGESGRTLQAAFAYRNVLCAGGDLSAGETVTVYNDLRSLDAIVRSGAAAN